MTKRLVIRFTRFDCALAMQILEQEGLFNNSTHVRIFDCPYLGGDFVQLRADPLFNYKLSVKTFVADIARDAYLDKVIKWISEEQFSVGGNIEIGKLCGAFDNEKEDEAIIGELLAILPEYCKGRYIVRNETCVREWDYYDNAQPVRCLYPEIKGDIYTWEM